MLNRHGLLTKQVMILVHTICIAHLMRSNSVSNGTLYYILTRKYARATLYQIVNYLPLLMN